MRNTVLMSLARRRKEVVRVRGVQCWVLTSAEQFQTIEAPRFKVTIKAGVVTDVWHRDEQRLPRSPRSFEVMASRLTRVWFRWPQPWYTAVHKCMCDKAVQADSANRGTVYTLHKCKRERECKEERL